MAKPNTRLSGVKQELSVFKSEFSSSFGKLKDKRGSWLEHNKHQEHNHQYSQKRKSKTQINQMSKHLDQYDRRNNIKIQGISTNVTDDELEGKVIDIFSCLSIEGCRYRKNID